jgi:hypothetical protein
MYISKDLSTSCTILLVRVMALGITEPELAILTLLLENKSPNTRTSTITLTNDRLTIQVKNGKGVENIQDVRDILNSLEKKGILKVDELRILKTEQKSAGVTRRHTESGEIELLRLPMDQRYTDLEKLNAMYITGQIKDEEYERLFSQISMQRTDRGAGALLPLTLIQVYITILKRVLSVASTTDLDRYDSILHYDDELRKLNNMFENNLVSFATVCVRDVVKALSGYLRLVTEIIGRSSESEVSRSAAFIYLYPFVHPFVEKGKKQVTVWRDDSVDKLKKEIQVEIEIISVLQALKEDERKIKAHMDKLRNLEHKLSELREYQTIDVYYLKVPNDLKNLLMYLLGVRSDTKTRTINAYFSVERLADQVVATLHAGLLKDATQSGQNVIEVDLNNVVEGVQKREDYTVGEKYVLTASLIWMNEHCPAMQDSIIDSEGRELEICRNPECFVVYHKKCLESLRQAGVHVCLVCGLPPPPPPP